MMMIAESLPASSVYTHSLFCPLTLLNHPFSRFHTSSLRRGRCALISISSASALKRITATGSTCKTALKSGGTILYPCRGVRSMSSIFEHSLPSNRTLAGMLSQTWWVVTSSLVARKIKKDNPQEGSFDGIIFCGDAPFQGGACVRINPIKASYNVTYVNRRSLLSEAALFPSRQTHSIS